MILFENKINSISDIPEFRQFRLYRLIFSTTLPDSFPPKILFAFGKRIIVTGIRTKKNYQVFIYVLENPIPVVAIIAAISIIGGGILSILILDKIEDVSGVFYIVAIPATIWGIAKIKGK